MAEVIVRKRASSSESKASKASIKQRRSTSVPAPGDGPRKKRITSVEQAIDVLRRPNDEIVSNMCAEYASKLRKQFAERRHSEVVRKDATLDARKDKDDAKNESSTRVGRKKSKRSSSESESEKAKVNLHKDLTSRREKRRAPTPNASKSYETPGKEEPQKVEKEERGSSRKKRGKEKAESNVERDKSSSELRKSALSAGVMDLSTVGMDSAAAKSSRR